jgi:hypothetical protein
MQTGQGPTLVPESPAAKRKEEERRMNHKPSLREKVKKLAKGKQQEEAALR